MLKLSRILSLALALFLIPRALAAPAEHVLVITIDGFASFLLGDPSAPVPTLRRLAAEGAFAPQGMTVVNPSVTWPNHTTLVTGVHPDRHGCLYNGVLERTGPGKPVEVNGQKNKSELVAVPTLFDIAHQAGLRTAGINWPCTRNSGTLHDDFPDSPENIKHTTPQLRDELLSKGILASVDDKEFRALAIARRDQIWTDAACHVIRTRKPNYMLFHMLVTDSLHHKYGAQSQAGYAALGMADAQMRDILRALSDAGILEKTAIFITADHGFEKASKILQPNVLFRQADLLDVGLIKITRARAQIVSEGGIAMVYLTNPETKASDKRRVIELMKGAEGIADILEPDKFAALGMPSPEKNNQMADLIFVAEDGYAFGNAAHGQDYVVDVELDKFNYGHHGVLSTNPNMNALFIAWGAGIKKGTKLPVVDNVDLAPTAAHLLGLQMKDIQGKVLKEVLAQ